MKRVKEKGNLKRVKEKGKLKKEKEKGNLKREKEKIKNAVKLKWRRENRKRRKKR